MIDRIVAAREPQMLPVVLSADEIVSFLDAFPGLRNRAALTTAYRAASRCGRTAGDHFIGRSRMLIRIERSRCYTPSACHRLPLAIG